ncbi:MAG: malic enzyme-like NAD(P)-binding protein [Alistipes sp.]|jgi:Malic enzyme|uniref:malic enzyme-like NAD(P)-binding protein n=1 Tax=Alistipes sp. TaxID=1872444 RepID=UPI001D3C9AF1|nr:malic enzyme-like NAD(P)-binding protein [Alistipes sp.]MBS6099543.1 malate dehydrogenase [Alistipes sp.]HJI20482.1 malate dehydrogenase [Rikenellaceae bacterium]
MKTDNLRADALRYHSEGRPGKIEVIPTKPYDTQRELSLAYSPGVAAPCLEIEKNPLDAYRYTAKGNLVAVISNGTAVLGLGNIGALASKPVMEGKSMLFKTFADVDAFDIEVDAANPDQFVETVRRIAPTFGGINLEDIKAPECFEIEERLRNELDIPVMHDDQHGTAIITSAALLNGLELAGKEIGEARVVINGAGAAAISCARLFLAVGIRREHIVLCDSRGAVTSHRADLTPVKREFATDLPFKTLEEALHGADVFLGVSKAGVLTPAMIRTMNHDPLVMALANPDPEITYDEAMASRPDIIFATGRSDYPNQVNNVLGFPYIFRGALDVGARKIDEPMKIAAAHAIAALAKEPVPHEVLEAYGVRELHFGKDYLIPKPLDRRLIVSVAPAVARAAMESGAARLAIADWDAYRLRLKERVERSNKFVHCRHEAEGVR